MSQIVIPNGTWTVDPTHSEVGFTVKHLMISKVRGQFNEFSGSAVVSNNPENPSAEINFEIQTASIDTNEPNRDGHLKSDDFFAVEQFPTLSFHSTDVELAGDEVKITGELTVRGVTRTETFIGTLGGVMVDPYGNTKASIDVSTKINRTNYGLTWNTALEAGGVLVSEQVAINVELQAVLNA